MKQLHSVQPQRAHKKANNVAEREKTKWREKQRRQKQRWRKPVCVHKGWQLKQHYVMLANSQMLFWRKIADISVSFSCCQIHILVGWFWKKTFRHVSVSHIFSSSFWTPIEVKIFRTLQSKSQRCTARHLAQQLWHSASHQMLHADISLRWSILLLLYFFLLKPRADL